MRRLRRGLQPEKDELNDEERSRERQAPPAADLGVRLREEMLPASEMRPDRLRLLSGVRISRWRVLGFLIILVMIALGWYFIAGPGAPVLEKLLLNLAERAPASTETPVPVTATVVAEVVNTPTQPPMPTARPSATPTSLPLSPTPTETVEVAVALDSGCVDALSVTLEDVGKTLCVQGTVLNTEEQGTAFLIAFGNEPGTLYFLSYDVKLEDLKSGVCVQATGEIMQLANSPVLIYGYTNVPEICP